MSQEEMRYNDCGDDAAPYVLGALTDVEHERFVEHLQSCAVCREEVAALQSVVAALPAAVPQTHAPADLKHRVMATVESEAGLREANDVVRARPLRGQRTRSSWRAGLGALAGAAAVAVVAVIALGGGSSTPRVIHAQVTVPKASASLRISGGHAELDVADMPQSTPGHVYEVWIKRDGNPQPTDALFTVSSAGDATVGVPGSIGGVKVVMVTSEPDGGSKVPTSAPVIVARLS